MQLTHLHALAAMLHKWVTLHSSHRYDGSVPIMLGSMREMNLLHVVHLDSSAIESGCAEMKRKEVMGAGKVTVHTAAAGIHPRWTLPIALDVGCDTQGVREDPLYVGLNQVNPHAAINSPIDERRAGCHLQHAVWTHAYLLTCANLRYYVEKAIAGLLIVFQ